MYNECSICGAAIGENNTVGVGGGCWNNIVIPAKKECFNATKGLELWIAKATALQKAYVECFAKRKFRSNFKKSFYESMTTAERISKKQFEIMETEMSYSYEHQLLIPSFGEIWKNMFIAFNPGHECPELWSEALHKHKILYFSGRKNPKAEAHKITKLPNLPITETPVEIID